MGVSKGASESGPLRTAKRERRETRRMLHLAVDVGGTFTDICLFDDRESATRVAKVSSTRDPIDAVFEGIGEMDIALGEITWGIEGGLPSCPHGVWLGEDGREQKFLGA